MLEYFYQDLTCLPDQEIGTGFLMGRLMHAVHLSLVNVSVGQVDCPIGIAFPGYRDFSRTSDKDESQPSLDGPPIGNQIRLFAQDDALLHSVGQSPGLARLRDYVHVKQSRKLVRPNLRFATFSRAQPKGSRENQIRRHMKRKGTSREEAERHFEGYSSRWCLLPYLDMRSHSQDACFRLFIRKDQVELPSERWGFSRYGLSRSVAVPDF
jgi:CRISPR-associated endonuclease Csy4